MFDFNSAEGYFLHLLKCALKDEQPEEKPSEVDWNKVFEIGLRQNAANLAWFSIEKLNNKPQGELFTVWQEEYAKTASKCLKQMMEIDFLTEEFSNRGYDIMFLKGSKIREYYPSPDMRTMTDIDLLVKSDKREPVREIMTEIGYIPDIMDDGQVDAFKKLPIIYTEVHYDFSDENHIHHEFFTIDWNKLEKTDRPHIYQMTFEDLYFFNVGHYVKNMNRVGMGIRGVIDCFVLWNKANQEQRKLILEKFEGTDIKKFNENLLKISDIWFNGAEDDGSLDKVQSYLLNTSTYGDIQKGVVLRFIDTKDNAKSKSKLLFLIQRIFPSKEFLFNRFNVKHRNVLLIPILWILRIILLPFSKGQGKDGRRNDIKYLGKFSTDDVDYEIEIRKDFGLL